MKNLLSDYYFIFEKRYSYLLAIIICIKHNLITYINLRCHMTFLNLILNHLLCAEFATYRPLEERQRERNWENRERQCTLCPTVTGVERAET